MPAFISLLRGINVSGQKLIKMDALKTMYQQLDFQNAETYLQSGNVIFRDDQSDPTDLAATISSKIQEQFGFDVPVIVLKVDDLKEIIEANPFKDDLRMDRQFLHVTFLDSDPKNIDFELIESKKSPGEEIVLIKKAVYLYCPHGYGRTKLTNNFLETKLRVGATTRNWKTVNELLKIALGNGCQENC
jgi:uncharacterized protein (DUF1697 family)